MSQTPYLSGQFLLAMPGIADMRFDRSVIAMCVHDPAGAMGICLHQPLDDLTVPDLMRQLEIDPLETPDLPVLMGGPVDTQRGFVLHSPDWGGQDTRHVAGRWALTGTRDVLEAIASGGGPRHWVAALGYVGWGAGQLDMEMSQHGWFPAPATTGLLWETDALCRWTRAYAGEGVDARMLYHEAGRA